MTIADIFDALTASDRPYKKAVPDRARAVDHRQRGAARASATPSCSACSSRARSTSGSSSRAGRDAGARAAPGALLDARDARRRVAARVRAALRALGRGRSSATLVFTDDDEIRTLNRDVPQATIARPTCSAFTCRSCAARATRPATASRWATSSSPSRPRAGAPRPAASGRGAGAPGRPRPLPPVRPRPQAKAARRR